jgi:mersacidin/lichenicidin family type 2 lantibiotic
MKNDEIIRAWRDADYFFDLSDEQRALLPANPVGMIELSQDALTTVAGGTSCAISCCSDCCNSCATGVRPHCCC